MKKILTAFLLLIAVRCYADVKLPAVISSNMVLQSNTNVYIWGTAEANEKIQVTFQKKTYSMQTGKDGRWLARIPPLKPGGPYTMTIQGKNNIKLSNILVGEVWVASGQSNMGMTVANSLNADREIKESDYPKIRLYTVTRNISYKPLEDAASSGWEECSPESVQNFSAAAYFFARELQAELNVPIGIINSSWGGSRAEAWTPRQTLKSLGTYGPDLKLASDLALSEDALKKKQEEEQAKWQKAISQPDIGNSGHNRGFAQPGFDISKWKTMDLPVLWEDDGLDIDGAVWFRYEVDIPPSWVGNDLILSLGALDDFDTTYFNNSQVGATGEETPNFWITPRNYTVPASLVKTGKNTIAVRIFDHYLKGGFVGPTESMILSIAGQEDSASLPLAGTWHYTVEYTLERPYLKMSPPSYNYNTATVLYNAMIHPLRNYATKGAIWYQGESNAGGYKAYETLFPSMITSWRNTWKNKNMPFIFVQLANYRAVSETMQKGSDWAGLRNAQMKTLSLPNTAMASAIDIGDAEDIHPKNKQDVGKRLALGALAVAYDKDIVYSGPIYKSMRTKGSTVRVSFNHTGTGLMARGDGVLKGFSIAGKNGVFVNANAEIDGDTVIVSSPGISKPKAVRYGWADNPVCNLYNKEGLPASPFKTD